MSVKQQVTLIFTCDECGSTKTEVEGAPRHADTECSDAWSKITVAGVRFDFCDHSCSIGRVSSALRRVVNEAE